MPVCESWEAFCERMDCFWVEHYQTKGAAERALKLHQGGVRCPDNGKPRANLGDSLKEGDHARLGRSPPRGES